MITDPPPTDSAVVPAPREKLDSEFSEEENKLEMAYTQAKSILVQSFPPPTTSSGLPPTQGLMLRCMMVTLLLNQSEELHNKCPEPKRKMDSQYFKDKALLMEAKEKGDVLDAEAEAFLADIECTAPYDQPKALTTTNMFQANHEGVLYEPRTWMKSPMLLSLQAHLSSLCNHNAVQLWYTPNDNQIF
ncbi:hypothetical protein Tco_0567701 [Tanacetum coccineum]